MYFKKLAVVVSAAAIIGTMTSAMAQETTQERLKDIARRALDQPELPQVDRTVGRASYDSGATHWISPMLRNAPGTISGEIYTIGGKRLTRTFEFSVINPNAENSVSAYIGCYDADGNHLSRYNQSFSVPPMGAVNWNSSSVTPPVSSDGVTEEVDDVWCVVGGNDPTVVFGWTVRKLGAVVSRFHFSLERAAPAVR